MIKVDETKIINHRNEKNKGKNLTNNKLEQESSKMKLEMKIGDEEKQEESKTSKPTRERRGNSENDRIMN